MNDFEWEDEDECLPMAFSGEDGKWGNSLKDGNIVLHNENGPALIGKESKQWFIHGLRHRFDGGPAISGSMVGMFEAWYMNDLMHGNDDEPAMIKLVPDNIGFGIGTGQSLMTVREWKKNGVLHRIGKPAVIAGDPIYHRIGTSAEGLPDRGTREWWVCGVRHRLDGPAVESPIVNQYWEYGVFKKERKKRIRKIHGFLPELQYQNVGRRLLNLDE